jgi:hypothetical protein
MRSQDPFLHPAVGKVIKAVWYEGTSRKPALASRFGHRHKSSLEGHDEKEVPEAMVTVAATAVRTQIVCTLLTYAIVRLRPLLLTVLTSHWRARYIGLISPLVHSESCICGTAIYWEVSMLRIAVSTIGFCQPFIRLSRSSHIHFLVYCA